MIRYGYEAKVLRFNQKKVWGTTNRVYRSPNWTRAGVLNTVPVFIGGLGSSPNGTRVEY